MSNLEALTQQYIGMRQGLGYRLEREAVQLPLFARFVIENGQDYVTVRLALEWAAQTPSGSAPAKWPSGRLDPPTHSLSIRS